jgi:hypothetical protein
MSHGPGRIPRAVLAELERLTVANTLQLAAVAYDIRPEESPTRNLWRPGAHWPSSPRWDACSRWGAMSPTRTAAVAGCGQTNVMGCISRNLLLKIHAQELSLRVAVQFCLRHVRQRPSANIRRKLAI